MPIDKIIDEQQKKKKKTKKKEDVLNERAYYTIMNAPGQKLPYLTIGRRFYPFNKPVEITNREAIEIDDMRSTSGAKMFVVLKSNSAKQESIADQILAGDTLDDTEDERPEIE